MSGLSGTIGETMLYLLTGENLFQRDQELARIAAGRDIERHGGSQLQPERLGEVLAGQSLFTVDSVTRIDDASANKELWDALEAWIERIDSDVVLCEAKPDKRTRTYKLLQKHAEVIVCEYWTDRQTGPAAGWLRGYAEEQGVKLTADHVRGLIARATRPSDLSDKPIIDQQLLASAVEQLRGAESITTELIDTVLAPSVQENVFTLLTSALDGKIAVLQGQLTNLRITQEPHRLLGLLSTQVANLAGLVLADGRSAKQVASDLGVNPYALGQLESRARTIDRAQLRQIVEILAEADLRIKRSSAEPWTIIEQALLNIASIRKHPD